MNDNTLLNQIGDLIDKKLEPIKQDLGIVKQNLSGVKEVLSGGKQEISAMKQQLDTVEMKVELVNKRVEKSQEETIDALSELIHEGYNLHNKRIKKIEDQLNLSQVQ